MFSRKRGRFSTRSDCSARLPPSIPVKKSRFLALRRSHSRFLTRSQSFLTRSQSFLTRSQNFLTRSQSFLTRSQSFLTWSQSFLTRSQSFAYSILHITLCKSLNQNFGLGILHSTLFNYHGRKFFVQSFMLRKPTRISWCVDSVARGSIDGDMRIRIDGCHLLSEEFRNNPHEDPIKVLGLSKKLYEGIFFKQSRINLECRLDLPLDVRGKTGIIFQ